MIEASVSVRDLQRLKLGLASLPTKIRKKILREETRKAAKAILLPPAKSIVPVRTGKLKKAIKVRAIKRTRKAVGVRVSATDKGFDGDVFYAGFLEYGWKTGKRGTQNRKQVKARGYMQKVVKRHGTKAVDKAAKAVGERIVKEWQK